MSKRLGSGMMLMGLWLAACFLLLPFDAYASAANGNATAGQGLCVSASQFQTPDAGTQIINTIFNTINTILSDVGETFYDSVIGNTNFQAVVSALIVLYVAIYGGMILFNLASYRTGEVVTRLVKIGIVYGIVTTGWDFFSTYVGTLFMGGMNELITEFAAASTGGITAVGDGTVTDLANPQLSTTAMTILTSGPNGGILSMVFSAKMWVVLTSLFTYRDFGPLLGIFLAWALFDFILMIIGAIGTYVKSIVGLTFLFGIAPIFFLFLLFEKTRQIFQGWLNQVISFALQPVLLFAFLSFYITLLTTVINNMIWAPGSTPDWCFTKFTSASGTPWDPQMWRANAYPDPQSGQLIAKNAGDWLTQPQTGTGGQTGGTTAPPPIPFIDCMYFLLLAHLGKNFCTFIEQIARDISSGGGGGVTSGTQVGGFIKNNFMGGQSPAGIAAKGASKVGSGISSLLGLR